MNHVLMVNLHCHVYQKVESVTTGRSGTGISSFRGSNKQHDRDKICNFRALPVPAMTLCNLLVVELGNAS